jgi:Protein of unknown function (DUF1592)/Protein of unknown function (DUF1588)/Protein of unknown function (DUF1587)/Protein of unknown function (DUF1585)/Protein of unknown function (DUF1595)/Planctomycete cytochrome C
MFFMRATLVIFSFVCVAPTLGPALEIGGPPEFHRDIEPVLKEYCYDCHGDGEKKGGVAFDELSSHHDPAEARDVWWRALKNLRGGLMPPNKKSQPTPAQKELIAQWIKTSVFESDPHNPNPGRVTVRRLNRVEYRNTIHDLIGVDFDTQKEFPPDDTGHGFDDIADVLTLPPMLLEKYLVAAEKIIAAAVPTAPLSEPETVIAGSLFSNGDQTNSGPLSLSYYSPASGSNTFTAQNGGQYQLKVDLMVNEKYVDNVFDYNKCRFIFRVDGRGLFTNDFSWEGGKPFHYDFDQDWAAGEHRLEFELQPLTPDEKQTRTLSLSITSVTVLGPHEKKFWVQPENHEKFFAKEIPETAAGRRAYARELLGDFAGKAFRRPVDTKTVERLVTLAESIYSQPGKTFEAGVAQAMTAVLASPRFLFREEAAESVGHGENYPLVDEYALASRLSYFFWSSMPDEELFRLAGEGKLRKNLSAQVARMLADERSEALVKNFTGQWLQARDIETVPIEARTVLTREVKFDPEADAMRKRFRALNDKPDEALTKDEKDELTKIRTTLFAGRRRAPRVDLTPEVRRAMRQETEQDFDYILREDRSVLELLDSDYTFLNERLARFYGLTNVVGEEMRRVTLPPDSPRGGVLTQGTVLAVTSNPTRTSPVKRGLFILDNILGIPPPPPPPNIPPLEDAAKGVTNHAPSLRETLALHRENPLCSSCHNRMDPLGLALENFNAMGLWRTQEFEQPIDATGKLITGEEFKDIKDLKRILVKNHYKDFYRTLTEKMLTYALGRGLEYYDVETVDQIEARLEQADGHPSALLMGIVESAPFQKMQDSVAQTATATINTVTKKEKL